MADDQPLCAACNLQCNGEDTMVRAWNGCQVVLSRLLSFIHETPNVSAVRVQKSLDRRVDATVNHVFVFLEIFACEGGIQSYVKDIFRAYGALPERPKAEIFLLRDPSGCENPFEPQGDRAGASWLKFHYLKTLPPMLGRARLTAGLVACLVWRRPQHVFCGHIFLAPLVQALCQAFSIPYTMLTYGKEVWEPLPPRYQKALQEADGIWTISRYSRDRICAANNINPKRVRILSCAVDGDAFTPGSKPQILVERYDLAGAKVLMTVARLWSGDIYKGVDVTIRALPSISKKFPNVKYLVIGRGDDRPRLAQLAKDLGVADRVVFAGFVPTEDLVEHYRVADAYIMPSQEGFGIVYLEAMACGIPVLSGDADGSADPLQDGRLGWRVPHRDPDAVAAACMEILKGDDQRCDGQWLRQQMLAQFGRDAFMQRLQELLAEKLDASHGKF